MSENTFSELEVRAFISASVPSYNRRLVFSSLEIAPNQLERIGLQLTGGLVDSEIAIETGSGFEQGKLLWEYVKKEVYEYFCTKSAKYRKERSEASFSLKNILMIISTAIASQFNLAIGVVTGAVTVAVITVFKVGKNAWCELNAEQLKN